MQCWCPCLGSDASFDILWKQRRVGCGEPGVARLDLAAELVEAAAERPHRSDAPLVAEQLLRVFTQVALRGWRTAVN